MANDRYRRLFRLPDRPSGIDRDLDEELRFHLDMRAEELRARGLTPDAARAEAVRQFGDVADAREFCRDEDERRLREDRRADWIEQLRQDTRLALRQLRRSPGFAVAAALTLAVGIGVTTAIYGVVHAYLVRPLPYPESDRLVSVRAAPSRDRFPNPPSLRDVDWRAADSVFAATVTWDLDGFTLPGDEGAEYVDGAWVSRGYFGALGMQPTVGRGFRPEEYGGTAPVALISDELWARRFRRDRSVVGRAVRMYSTDRPLESELVTIVGIMPPDVWHLSRFTNVLRPLGVPNMPYIGLLRRGSSIADAEARLNAVVLPQLGAVDPAWRMSLSSLQGEYTYAVRPILVALLGASAFMLLIAVASVAGALVARSASRRPELAVRSALGASRGRLVRQLLTESGTLAAVGAIGGVALARVLLEGVGDGVADHLGASVPGGASRLTPSGTMLLLALASSVTIGVVFGLMPALSSTRVDPGAALRAAGRGGAIGGAARIRRSLIAGQIALTMVLLVGAGLMARTVIALAVEPFGFRAEGVVKGDLLLPRTTYRDSIARATGIERVLAGVRAEPGIRSAAAVFPYPFRPGGPVPVVGAGAVTSIHAPLVARPYTVTPTYFDVMEIPIVGGRPFTGRDDAGAPRVAIVSEDLGRRLWGGENPIGRRIRIAEDSVWHTVVGIARETREALGQERSPDVYLAYAQHAGAYLSIVVRTTAEPRTIIPGLRRAVGRVDDVLALADVRAMSEIVERNGARHRVLALLLGVFALFALGLAVLGLYSTLSYVVAQRARELAVRVAIGANGRAITRLLLAEGAPMVAVGIAGGVVLSVALRRVLASQLYGVSATDPATFVGIAIVLALAALAAVMGPARRAARVDPSIVLRTE
jgi:predicted permease